MYVWEEMEDVLYDLRGTQFQINSNAYLNLRGAELMRIRTANS